jgi:hypothetical protein
MRKEIELGDVLVATSFCEIGGESCLMVGEQYIVNEVNEINFWITDDEGDYHGFPIAFYRDFFEHDYGNPVIEVGKCYAVESESFDVIALITRVEFIEGEVKIVGDYISQNGVSLGREMYCGSNRRITETPEKLNWLNYCLAHNKTITEEEYNALPKSTPGISWLDKEAFDAETSWISLMEEENFSKASSEFITPLKKNIKKKHLLKDLETLVIKGIDLCEMVRDLQKDNFELINRIVASEKRNLELLREIDVLKEDCNQLRLCCKIN